MEILRAPSKWNANGMRDPIPGRPAGTAPYSALTDGQEIANVGHWPRLWDAHSGRLVAPLTARREISTFRPITFDPSRDAILMGSQDGRVYAWDLKTKRRIAVSPPQPAYVDTLAV